MLYSWGHVNSFRLRKSPQIKVLLLRCSGKRFWHLRFSIRTLWRLLCKPSYLPPVKRQRCPSFHTVLTVTRTHVPYWWITKLLVFIVFVSAGEVALSTRGLGHIKSLTSQLQVMTTIRSEYKSAGFWFFFGTKSYLLREVMCSSDRPPSSSLMMNSLSFSSPGCTGKLLRKMSRRTID